MKRMIPIAATALAALTGQALAQPTITSLGGSGARPVNVTNPISGTQYIGSGGGYWTLGGGVLTFISNGGNGAGGGRISEDAAFMSGTQLNDGITGGGIPRIFGNTASGVSPAFSLTPTLVPSTTLPAVTESAGRRYNVSTNAWQSLGALQTTPSLHVFGSSSNGSTSGAFLNPVAMSSTGRFIGGMGYSCQYSSSAGTTITANTFRWRPWIWDAQANGGLGGMTVLSTPTQQSATWRRRDGIVYGISTDGTVICGAQNHGTAAGLSADPDGARPVVWRWNSTTSTYDFSYLPGGDNGAGQFYTISLSIGSMHMNNAGTIIVAPSVNTSGGVFLAKWVWNSGTNSWDPPINIGYSLTAPPSWLPAEITACGAGTVVPTFGFTGLSEDGNTLFGYSEWKCGSNFALRGGWIWRASDPVMRDWYDYLNTLGVPGVAPGGPWGPIGDFGDNTKGQPYVGFPVDVSLDGNTFVGFHAANAVIVGAQPWILQMSGGSTCVAPTVTLNPSNTTFSRCSFGSTTSTIILNTSASGTAPFTYQWNKNGSPISDGTTPTGSIITGATTAQIRISRPGPSDAGSYTCTITGCSGLTTTTLAASVQPDAAVAAPANDVCANATPVGEGTTNFNPCGAYVDDGASTCSGTLVELADVWFRYTPTFTGDARFQTCGSSFDTTLQIHQGGCNGGVLACNNDVGTRGLAGLGAACSSSRSLISRVPVTAGVPVWVRISCITTPTSNSATSGALVISQAPPTPANDLCANATQVGLGTFPFNLSEATDDFTLGSDICSNPVDSQTASNRDVWFRFTSTCGGTYTFSTCGLASPNITNPMLHLMDDCNGGTWICDDNSSGCTVGGTQQALISGFVMTPGQSVLVRVSQSGTGSPGTNVLSGSGQLNITATAEPTGACCVGTTCSISCATNCTGTFSGVGTACGPTGNPTTCCPANFNGVGGVSVQDIFDFLNAWFANLPSADFNGVGGVSVQDIFDFLAAWFTGC